MSSSVVNASTSLVLVDTTNTSSIVYLSTLQNPGTLITIRDSAGFASANSSIHVSTTVGVSFFDSAFATSGYRITQPYGYLTLTPRTSNVWALVNSFAFPNQTAAFVNTVTTSTIITNFLFQSNGFISSQQGLFSTIGVNCNAPQASYSLDINGALNASSFFLNGQPFIADGNISTLNSSTLNVNGRLNFLGGLSTFPMSNWGGGVDLMDLLYVTSTNRVGISTLNPNFTLDVRGGIYGFSTITSTGIVQASLTASSIRSLEAQISTTATSTIQNTLGTIPVTMNTFVTLQNARSPSIWVAGGIAGTAAQSLLYSSDNGSNWLPAASGGFFTASNLGCRAIAFNGSAWVAAGEGQATPQGHLQFSMDGSNWSNTTNQISGGLGVFASCVGWNGRYWIAGATIPAPASGVGLSNVQISSNGTNWTSVTSAGFTQNMSGVAWNGRYWVGVGLGASAAASIEYSFDGLNWVNAASGGFTGSGFGVAWNGQLWVAVGVNSTAAATIKYSFDGSNWSNSSSGSFTTNGGFGVAWNGRMWVAVGNGGSTAASIKYSMDGINWLNSQSGGFTSDGRGIAWNGSRWIATGVHSTAASNIQISSDGINWTAPTSGAGTYVSTFATAFSSNVNADLQFDNLGLYGKSQYPFTFNTNTMYMGNSTLQINNVLTVQNPRVTGSNVGINTVNPAYNLDVNGTAQIVNSNMQTSTLLLATVAQPGANSNLLFSYDAVNWAIAPTTGFPTTAFTVLRMSNNGNIWVASGSGGIRSSYNGFNWITANTPSGFTSALGRPAWNGSYWLAFGSNSSTANGNIIMSRDGINWINTSNTLNVTHVTGDWNGNMWVVTTISATGTQSLRYSYDGMNWSNIVSGGFSPNGNYGASVKWNGRLWVACGNGATRFASVQHSYDGLNWSNATTIGEFVTTYNDVAWNGYLWVIGGAAGVVQYSYDGINWNMNTYLGSEVLSIAWDGKRFVAIGNGSSVLRYSINGINWSNATGSFIGSYGVGVTASTAPPTLHLTGLNYITSNSPGLYEYPNTILTQNSSMTINGFVTIQNTASLNPTLDINGITNTSSFITSLVRTPATSSNVWVAGGWSNNGSNGILKYSLDGGSNWATGTGFSFSGASRTYAMCYNGEYFLGYITNSSFNGGNFVRSSNGINWSILTPVTGTNTYPSQIGYNLIWTGRFFIMSGRNNTNSNATIARSEDGLSWTPAASGNFATTNNNGFGIAFNGRRLVAATSASSSSGILKYSDDQGLNWISCTVANPFVGGIGGIATNGRIYVAVSNGATPNGSIKYSFDGITFIDVASNGFNNFGGGVAWNGTLFVAVGADFGGGNTIKYSFDGINWINASNGFFSNGQGVAWNGREFIAVGVDDPVTLNRYIKISRDGITWTNSTSGSDIPEYHSIAFSSNVVPDLRIDNLAVYGKAQYSYTTSTNMVHLGTSSITFNSLLTVQNPALGGTNIGIGTANPRFVLDIRQPSGTGAFSIQNNSSTGNASVDFFTHLDSYVGSIGYGNTNSVSGGNFQDKLWIYHNTKDCVFLGSGAAERMRVTSGGNVGIGKTNPTTFLDIYQEITGTIANSNQNFGLRLSNSSGGGIIQGGDIHHSIFFRTGRDLANDTLSFYEFGRIRFFTGGVIENQTEKMSILSNGNIGIGVSNPLSILDLANRNDTTRFAVTRNEAQSAQAQSLLASIGNSHASLWPVPFSDSLYFYYKWNGAQYQLIIPDSAFFTGQHGCYVDGNEITPQNLHKFVGMIVSSADKGYVTLDASGNRKTGKDAIWITEALPVVKLTNKDKDKAVFGVVTNHANDQYDTDGNPILDQNGEWAGRIKDRIRVNGLGEGAIWVTNINGVVENGDFICSSVIPGYGRRQDDDILHNYTVAKATMSCMFELNQNNYVCEEFTYAGKRYRRAFIGCTYHCS